MNVVGIGQCSLDYLFLIDSYPIPDTKKEVIDWAISGGGPVATALVSLSRLGVKCRFYGIIGDDEIGQEIEESLVTDDIDVKGLLKRQNSTSQIAFIVVEKGTGRRTIFWKRPSGEPLKIEEMPNYFLDNADFLLLDGLMTDASIYAAEKARAKNIPVMLDAGKMREGMIEIASMCDYVVAFEEFGKELIGINDLSLSPSNQERALVQIKSLNTKICTITLGDKGSITLAGDEIFHVPAFKVKVVDTTGAGDVFHGGYIYGLLQGWDIKNVVRFATAFAALKCRKLGGRAGIPSMEEIETFLNASGRR